MFLFGAGVAAGFLLSFLLGYDRGTKEVIATCMSYNKYSIDGTMGLNCFPNPDPTTIKIIDTKVGKKTNAPWVKK